MEINRAGDIIIGNRKTMGYFQAINILDNWRAIHSYPMHVFKVRLKKKAIDIDKNALTVQRLKRAPAIIKKLQRKYNGRPPTMKLSQMQDIGGCRAVLSSVHLAYKLCNQHYLKGDLKHKRMGMKDYIKHPKNDGYRGIHLIYKYLSDKGKKEYNDLLVEIQIRSKLQHLWATAIETVDFFTEQAIKSSEGQEEWIAFFKLVSSAFALMEKCPLVPNTPINEKELYLEIKRREAELKVLTVMSGWTQAIERFEKEIKQTPKLQYFLLKLDISGKEFYIFPYTKDKEQEAIMEYAKAEKENRDKRKFDVVLIGADTSTDLKKAYPNYYVDNTDFLAKLETIINKY